MARSRTTPVVVSSVPPMTSGNSSRRSRWSCVIRSAPPSIVIWGRVASTACARSLTSCSAMRVVVLSCYGAARAARLVGRCWREPARLPPRSHPGVVAQVLDAVRLLPAEFRLGAAEMTVGRRLLVDGPAEGQELDDPGGREGELAAQPPVERSGVVRGPAEKLGHERDPDRAPPARS